MQGPAKNDTAEQTSQDPGPQVMSIAVFMKKPLLNQIKICEDTWPDDFDRNEHDPVKYFIFRAQRDRVWFEENAKLLHINFPKKLPPENISAVGISSMYAVVVVGQCEKWRGTEKAENKRLEREFTEDVFKEIQGCKTKEEYDAALGSVSYARGRAPFLQGVFLDRLFKTANQIRLRYLEKTGEGESYNRSRFRRMQERKAKDFVRYTLKVDKKTGAWVPEETKKLSPSYDDQSDQTTRLMVWRADLKARGRENRWTARFYLHLTPNCKLFVKERFLVHAGNGICKVYDLSVSGKSVVAEFTWDTKWFGSKVDQIDFNGMALMLLISGRFAITFPVEKKGSLAVCYATMRAKEGVQHEITAIALDSLWSTSFWIGTDDGTLRGFDFFDPYKIPGRASRANHIVATKLKKIVCKGNQVAMMDNRYITRFTQKLHIDAEGTDVLQSKFTRSVLITDWDCCGPIHGCLEKDYKLYLGNIFDQNSFITYAGPKHLGLKDDEETLKKLPFLDCYLEMNKDQISVLYPDGTLGIRKGSVQPKGKKKPPYILSEKDRKKVLLEIARLKEELKKNNFVGAEEIVEEAEEEDTSGFN